MGNDGWEEHFMDQLGEDEVVEGGEKEKKMKWTIH